MSRSFEILGADQGNIDEAASGLIAELESDFLIMPRGRGFVGYDQFQAGYEVLKRNTGGFGELSVSTALRAVHENSIALIVLRSMLGFTPPEWA